jgi:hypothetical protein
MLAVADPAFTEDHWDPLTLVFGHFGEDLWGARIRGCEPMMAPG